MKIWGILLAAGQSTRMGREGLAVPKQFMEHGGLPLFWQSVRTFARLPGLCGLVVAFPPALPQPDGADLPPEFLHYCPLREKDTPATYYARYLEAVRVKAVALGGCPGVPLAMVCGGAERQHSVARALEALPKDCEAVLVHDTARPFASNFLLAAIAEHLSQGAEAVIPGVPVVDTIKIVDASGLALQTPERASLRAVQTPQGFSLPLLRQAHDRAAREGFTGTDDAQLVERMNIQVLVIPGEEGNVKITSAKDLRFLHRNEAPCLLPCTGFGYDVHRYGGNRPFVLGGVPIATDILVQAHSDGDVLLHALMDALLGCMGAGDIGGLFPDTDPDLEGVESGILLSRVMDMWAQAGLTLVHVDLTIIAQAPKIAPHRAAIAANVAKLLHLDEGSVGVKATTEERLGFTGEKKGMKAVAVVSALKPALSFRGVLC
jgi:2-C-methyl-D-erythritol 2,4-cyclodiphosphate synthase